MTPMEELLAAASAHVFTERELKLLASIEINNATQAMAEDRYATAIRCLEDAKGHLRALLEQRR